MRPIRSTFLALLCVVPTALAGAPAAHADAFTDVFKAYSKTGTISPCAFTAAQLTKAKGQIPNDYEQYAPDFKDAIDAAAKARAGGACKKKPSAVAAPAPAAGTASPSSGGGTPGPGVTPAPAAPKATATPATAGSPAQTPAPVAATPQPAPAARPAPAVADGAILTAASSTQDNGGDLPAPLVALAFVALLAALVTAALAAARWWAVDAPWMQRSRHATAEAGWRTSAAWAEFTDWLRLGR